MQKKLVYTLFLIIFFMNSRFVLGVNKNHLTELNMKFPYGLLNNDHNILNIRDLAKNACESSPIKFLSGEFTPYQYWQCFESKNISFNCDSDGTRDEYEGIMGLVVVKVSSAQEQHRYIERRLWPIKDCTSFVKDLKSLIKSVRYACISGSFPDIKTDKNGRHLTGWIFERIKTKKGCEGHDCKFTHAEQNENCPELKF